MDERWVDPRMLESLAAFADTALSPIQNGAVAV
jgi:hypothetical protein